MSPWTILALANLAISSPALAGAQAERLALVGIVRDRAGAPVPGVRVLAASPRYVEGQSWLLGPLDEPSASTESDANGAFRLPVERGELHVSLRGAGWIELDLVRTPSKAAVELDLGVLTLERGARLPGRVLDPAGQPVAGARVLRTGHTDLSSRTRLEWGEHELARSAADGTFVLEGLAFGRTQLEVRAPGFVRARQAYFASAVDCPEWRVELARAAPIRGRVVGAPADVALQVSFWLADPHEQRSVPCAADGSFVIDELAPDHAPVALVAQTDAPLLLGSIALTPAVEARPGTSDVELRVPPASRYRVKVADAATQAPLAAAHIGLLEVFPWESARPCIRSSTAPGEYELGVVLPEAGTERALLVTCPGYECVALGGRQFEPGETHDFGTVLLARLPTTLVRVQRGGEPVAGARVVLSHDDGCDGCGNCAMNTDWPARMLLPHDWHGTTASDGTVRAEVASGQQYWVSVTHDAHAPLWTELQTEPAPPAELELELVHGGTVTVSCVESRTRTPLPGQRIAFESERWSARNGEEVETDTDGRARFEHLAPGRARFWLPELGQDESEVGIAVTDGAELELVLPRPAASGVRVHGLVTEGGRPLAGAMLEIQYTETATNAEGRYELDGLRPGAAERIVTHPRFGRVYADGVSLVAPETRADLALELAPIAGVVRDGDGRPVVGVELSLGLHTRDGGVDVLWVSGRAPSALYRAESGADGRFRFEAVQARDDLWLVAERDGYLPQRVGPLVLHADGSTLELAPVLERAEALAVVVQGCERELGVIVSATWLGAEALPLDDREQRATGVAREPRDASELHFRFERLRPGPWAIELRRLFSLGDDQPLARVEVMLPRTVAEPLILRP